jgi:hypothetical protein
MIRDDTGGSDRERAAAFESFVEAALAGLGSQRHGHLQPVTGDASFRRFHRIATAGGTSLVAVDAPPATENNGQYARLAALWRRAGLRVPQVHAADLARGFFVVEDLGRRRFADAIAEPGADVDALYRAAIDTLVDIQQLPDDGSCPPYDAARLRMEVSLFAEWLAGGLLRRPPSAAQAALLAAATDLLVDNLLAQPRCTVHRDYHSRNLLVCADGGIGIVDFQDALRGPYAYDVVSLLRDCYVRLDDARIAALLAWYRLRSGCSTAALQSDFDHAGIQRHLKAAGIFARLWLRDGRPHYLGDIPRVLDYLVDVAGRYPPPLSTLAEYVADVREAVSRGVPAATTQAAR